MAAVEFVKQTEPLTPFGASAAIGPRVAKRALHHGVITRALPAADTVSFSPPFTTSAQEISDMVAGVRRALDDVYQEESRGD